MNLLETWNLFSSTFGQFMFSYFIFTIIFQFFKSENYDNFLKMVGGSLLFGFVTGIIYALVVVLL